MLLKTVLKKENTRKVFIKHTLLESTKLKLEAFDTLQSIFDKFTFLTHFNLSQWLYINIDIFKQFDFRTMIYYVKDNSTTEISRADIRSILFLSKLFNTVKSNYWSMKLKVAGLVWTVKKIQHMLESK